MANYKICICGPSGSGKTSYLNMILNNTFTKKYTPTVYVDLKTFICHTNYGKKAIHACEVAGDRIDLVEKFIKDCDGVLLFIPVCKNYSDVVKTYINIVNRCGKKVVIVMTKSDGAVISHKFFPMSTISTKDRLNLEDPILKILRMLTFQDLRLY